MTRYIVLLLVTGLQPLLLLAQSNWWKEWFDQKNTQREYLMKQIAALKVYGGYVKQGYNIYKAGHQTIGQLKRGELHLHTDFFNSLQHVRPEIATYARVADIVSIQLRIIRICNSSLQSARSGGYLNAHEIAYMSRVYERLLHDCGALADELLALTTSGNLEMKDDERLQRIDLLYPEMQDKLLFAETFSGEAELLARARAKEQSDIRTLRTLSGQQP